jgi:hypothetical protein
MPRGIRTEQSPQFDRVVGVLAAIVVVGLAVFLLVRNQPIADPKLFFVLRVVMSLSAATLGSTIPGFLNVGRSGGGLIIRAGGALALFVLTFIYIPDLLTENHKSTINQSSTGPFSPPIGTNSGTIVIDGTVK